LTAVILCVGGIIMLLLEVIGEYVGRIYIRINNSPQYVIRNEINFQDQSSIQEKDLSDTQKGEKG